MLLGLKKKPSNASFVSSLKLIYRHYHSIKFLRLKDVPCVGVPFPSVCFSNQQLLVLHRGHSANISSLFHTCSKQVLVITVCTLVIFLYFYFFDFVLFFPCPKPVRVMILKKSEKLIFFYDHRPFRSRETVMFNRNESLCSLHNVIYSSSSTYCGLGILYPS